MDVVGPRPRSRGPVRSTCHPRARRYRPCLCSPAWTWERNPVLCRRCGPCSHFGQTYRTPVPCSCSHRRTSPDQRRRSDRRVHSRHRSQTASPPHWRSADSFRSFFLLLKELECRALMPRREKGFSPDLTTSAEDESVTSFATSHLTCTDGGI